MSLRWMKVLLLALALPLSLPADGGAAGGEIGRTPEGIAIYPWDPGESWPGGAQFDPRLDQTVDFWGAGIPLKDVFADIHQQTGVEIDFHPAGDMNERVCVNLYLNAEDPPTLREVMAQLSWVTECTYGCSQEEVPRYWLLSTSAGSGALERLFDWADRASSERSARRQQIAREMRQAAEARLDDLREALAVPEEDLVETYRGVDDLVLLAVLDPPRRAFSQFLVGIPNEVLAGFSPGGGLGHSWSAWTAAQQSMLQESIRPRLEEWAESHQQYAGEPGNWNDWEWVEQRLAIVALQPGYLGGFGGSIWIRGRHDELGDDIGIELPMIQLVFDPREEHSEQLRVGSDIALRRLLGEEISEDDARRMQEEVREARRRREQEEEVARQLRRQHPLARENEALLASLTLPVTRAKPYALWQLQELVAARSGLHIVSDCFWQPERSLDLAFGKLYPDSQPELSALTVLRAATLPADMEIGPGTGYLSDGGVSWEWGDAGDFLRFRDYHRDACRDVFLSQEAVSTLDHWVDACLPDDLDAGGGDAVEVPLDPRECGLVLRPLTPAQRRYGWHLIYGDPTDTRNAYRHAFRTQLKEALRDQHPYLLFARLSDEQWDRLQTKGLTWGADVLLQRGPRDRPAWGMGWRAYKEGDELRLEDVDDDRRARLGERVGVTSWEHFYVHREGWDPPRNMPFDDWLPLGVAVKPKSTERLIEPGTPEAEETALTTVTDPTPPSP